MISTSLCNCFIPGRDWLQNRNAKIILNGTEFNNPGEMSVDDRRLYHEALAAVFPASIAVSVNEAPKIKPKKVWLIVAVVSKFCQSCLSLARFFRLKR